MKMKKSVLITGWTGCALFFLHSLIIFRGVAASFAPVPSVYAGSATQPLPVWVQAASLLVCFLVLALPCVYGGFLLAQTIRKRPFHIAWSVGFMAWALTVPLLILRYGSPYVVIYFMIQSNLGLKDSPISPCFILLLAAACLIILSCILRICFTKARRPADDPA